MPNMPVSAAYYEAKQQKFVVVSYLWFIKLTFMVVSHGIFLVELFLRPPLACCARGRLPPLLA